MSGNKKFLYILIFIRLVFPYLLQHEVYEPHRDEFLYLAEGNHLAFGYMEVPPLLSVFSWLTHLMGDGMFWIKLWPSLFGAATFYIMGSLVLSLGGRRFALFLLFLSFTFTAYLRVFFLFMPNAPEVFFWSLLAFSAIRFIQTQQNGWLYVFGVSAGLGMLTKYSVAFYIVAILLGLLFTPGRKVFANRHFWYGALIGFLIFLPNLWWQYDHHFPFVYHMTVLRKTQLQYISAPDFLKDQLVMFLPCAFVWIAGLYNIFYSSDKRFRFVGLAYIFVLCLLIAGSGKGYYALGTYPVLFAFGAYNLEKFTAGSMKSLRNVFAGLSLLIGLIFLPVALPVFQPERLARLFEKGGMSHLGVLQWEDLKNHPLPQDFSDMLGWEEAAKKVGDAYHSLPPEEKEKTMIFASNYGLAGAINYYGKKYSLPEAYSDNASFLYWLPDSVSFRNLILVTEDSSELRKDYIKYFDTAYITGKITEPLAREHGDIIVMEKGADERFNQYYMDLLQEEKKKLVPFK